MAIRSGNTPPSVLPGLWTASALPAASADTNMMAWVTDRPGGPGFMFSNGSLWLNTSKRGESYAGTTDASGNFSVTYMTPFSTTPNVQPVTYPPADAVTRVRVTAADQNGFTVHTETNPALTVLTLSVLGFAAAAVPSVPVRVFVYES